MKELTETEFKKTELGVLKKIDEICLANNIQYYLAFGTLLGAIRHKGFIPWDDDVDVWMPRQDYQKFIDYCINNEEEIAPFKIAHYRNNKKYCMAMARIFDGRTVVQEEHVRNYGLGVFVDVYPLDGCGNSPEEAERVFVKNKRKRFLAGIGAPEAFESSNSGIIKNIIKYCIYKYVNLIGLTKILYQMDCNSQKYEYNTSEYVASTVWAIYRNGKSKTGWIGLNNGVDIFRKDWFEKTNRVLFENIEVSIPAEYEKILSNRYGDYMVLPPENEQHGHHNFVAYYKG